MKRVSIGLAGICLVAGLLAGCGAKATATTACAGRPNDITICVNGKPIDFTAEKSGPHRHDPANNLYAPVVPLAKALGLDVKADPTAKTVTINGKPFVANTDNGKLKGIHVHDGVVFVPLKDFANAAGLNMEMDIDKGTAGFAR